MMPTRADVLRKYRIGTAADTPASLRAKAAEFLRLASNTRDLYLSEELRLLAALYAERAAELEKATAVIVVTAPEANGKS
jgi:hypothetical protein